jgi:hypothetical protein
MLGNRETFEADIAGGYGAEAADAAGIVKPYLVASDARPECVICRGDRILVRSLRGNLLAAKKKRQRNKAATDKGPRNGPHRLTALAGK